MTRYQQRAALDALLFEQPHVGATHYGWLGESVCGDDCPRCNPPLLPDVFVCELCREAVARVVWRADGWCVACEATEDHKARAAGEED